ncbi:hypothetical protein KC367_g201 [Hortaea werneckii]|nr:hypothetical protein KC367_g201 [Hortaea werneckii]
MSRSSPSPFPIVSLGVYLSLRDFFSLILLYFPFLSPLSFPLASSFPFLLPVLASSVNRKEMKFLGLPKEKGEKSAPL